MRTSAERSSAQASAGTLRQRPIAREDLNAGRREVRAAARAPVLVRLDERLAETAVHGIQEPPGSLVANAHCATCGCDQSCLRNHSSRSALPRPKAVAEIAIVLRNQLRRQWCKANRRAPLRWIGSKARTSSSASSLRRCASTGLPERSICDIGGVAGPIVSGFLIVSLGYANCTNPPGQRKSAIP
jgi:hypothetical protein